MIIKKGTTSRSVYLKILSSVTGNGLTALVYNSASLTAYYVRTAGTPTAISLVTLANAQAAWSSGGFVKCDDTNMPGLYRLDLPDAVLASGVNEVVVTLKGATNMADCDLKVELVDFDPFDTIRLGLTAMPNAASGAAGAILTSGTGTAQLAVTGGRANADVLYWNASAVSAPNVAGFPVVDVSKNAGTAITAASGRQEVNVSHFGGTAGTFSGGIADINLAKWRGTQPAALSNTFVQASAQEIASALITATSIAANALTSAKVDSTTNTAIANAVKASVIETAGSYTIQQALSIMLAALAGVTSSSGNTLKTPDGTATRIAATVSSNTRTAMTLTPSA